MGAVLMQIFITYPDYSESAASLDDKRMNKQIIELGQILSTAIWIENCDLAETLYAEGKIYLPTHENHPVIRNCKYYYFGAIHYFTTLMLEYRFRFNKEHSCHDMFYSFWNLQYLFVTYPQMEFQNHTTNHKHIENVYDAYKKELQLKWKHDKIAPKWTNRPTPEFYKGE